LQVLAFELLETLLFHTSQPGTFALVTLSLPHPLAQGLRGTADLASDRDDRRPLRLVLPLMLEHHPNSPFTELQRILRCCFHDSILSRIGVSGKPRAVHTAENPKIEDAAEPRNRKDPQRPNADRRKTTLTGISHVEE